MMNGKIKEINLLTTDGTWWNLLDDVDSIVEAFEASWEKDETIANKLLVQMSVKAGKWFEMNDYCDVGKPMYINTANIIAIEVIRESED